MLSVGAAGVGKHDWGSVRSILWGQFLEKGVVIYRAKQSKPHACTYRDRVVVCPFFIVVVLDLATSFYVENPVRICFFLHALVHGNRDEFTAQRLYYLVFCKYRCRQLNRHKQELLMCRVGRHKQESLLCEVCAFHEGA